MRCFSSRNPLLLRWLPGMIASQKLQEPALRSSRNKLHYHHVEA